MAYHKQHRPSSSSESTKFEDFGYAMDDLEFYELSHCNLMEDVGLDDIQLIRISTKDLNKHLKMHGVHKDRQKEVKARRRTLKNRGYAASCRVKRDNEESKIIMDIKYLDGKIEEKSNAIQTLATEKESIINYIQEFGVSREEIDEYFYGKMKV